MLYIFVKSLFKKTLSIIISKREHWVSVQKLFGLWSSFFSISIKPFPSLFLQFSNWMYSPDMWHTLTGYVFAHGCNLQGSHAELIPVLTRGLSRETPLRVPPVEASEEFQKERSIFDWSWACNFHPPDHEEFSTCVGFTCVALFIFWGRNRN